MRTQSGHFILLGLCLCVMELLEPVPGAAAHESIAAPNIILILADDLGYGSIGCYGSKDIRTPHIDRLAASGIRFTDFHANGALCSPTRAALLTGRYQQRCIQVPDEHLSPVFRDQRQKNPAQRWAWGIATNEVTISRLLQQAGYRTGLIGKWHLGYDIQFHPMNYGFDEFRGYMGGNVDYHTHIAGYGLKQLDWWSNREIRNEAGYTTDLLTRYATDFIARNKSKPFFLFLAHGAPHDPWQGRDSTARHPPAATYREMIEVLDESVGAVAAALLTHHLERSTLLIFCSDNGASAPPELAANGRLRGRKGTLLEGGHRVPFIASWPGVIAPHSTNNTAAMTMDLFPTFAKLAKARVPETHVLDGVDLTPALKGDTNSGERILHWHNRDSWAVRKGPWKLMADARNSLTLVNLDKDITERSNRLNELRAIAEELRERHRQWLQSVGSN